MPYQPNTPETYESPLPAGEFTFVNPRQIYPYPTSLFYPVSRIVKVRFGNELLYSGQDDYTVSLQPGTYTVFYGLSVQQPGTPSSYDVSTSTYTFTVVENQLPLKKWTATDVINRVLDIAEPLRRGETPRFRLQGMNTDGTMQAGSQAALFDTILSPEFSFTKQTLRECLQEIGQIVHGEPRLTPVKDSTGTWYYEVSYDLYGQTKQWMHANRAYVKKQVTQNINTYASSLDTHAENLINKNGNDYGVITEPYAGGAKTVRTEQMYVQITEQNMIIPTLFPIYTVDKVEWIRNSNGTLQSVDITPYLFESSIYGAQLSSYDSLYPYSKAYALMYTQGEKNITQLSFKQDNPISSAFENYAILNILQAATGENNLTVDYPQLAFRVTYTPFYQSRVGQTKVNYRDYKRPAAMIYNQQANVIESRAYGENLKGVIARLGNAEKSYTYRLSRLKQIPTPGMLFDEDYTISGAYVEILPNIINCTIALTKNFNRISQYVGISSVKRYSQVSQTMALERNRLWTEYIVVGDSPQTGEYTPYPLIGTRFLLSLSAIFTQDNEYAVPFTHVTAWGMTGEDNPLPSVSLPVIASSFGNSISFSWEYEDNYSAGPVSVYRTGGTGGASVSGYYQNDYQYTDYYGKVYYYGFQIEPEGEAITASNYLSVANALPGTDNVPTSSNLYISTVNTQPYILRKDNREKLQCNYQIDFVANRKGLVIGSALAANCPALRGTDSSRIPRLYVLPERINKFADNVQSLGISLSGLPNMEVSVTSVLVDHFSLTAGNYPASGKAWVICTPVTTTTEQVEDERGVTTTQTVTRGGDILLAQNVDFEQGDEFDSIGFWAARDVFDKTVWKDIS